MSHGIEALFIYFKSNIWKEREKNHQQYEWKEPRKQKRTDVSLTWNSLKSILMLQNVPNKKLIKLTNKDAPRQKSETINQKSNIRMK